MKVVVVGCGYVGLVTAAMLAADGHTVVGVESDGVRLAALREGVMPFFEPGLDGYVLGGLVQGLLSFTGSIDEAVSSADVVVLAVGTPTGFEGSADLSGLFRAAEGVDLACRSFLNRPILVVKSTVPVGTCRKLDDLLGGRFEVAHVPEFLSEGTAILDTQNPSRVVIGVARDGVSVSSLVELFAPRKEFERILVVDRETAELSKVASNVLLASRVALANEIADLAEESGADAAAVLDIAGRDPRIGGAFLRPGPGYGGSCFPKDVRAFSAAGKSYGLRLRVGEAIESSNSSRVATRILPRIMSLAGDPGHAIAVWGLAFKAGTSDIRESPAVSIVRALAVRGYRVRVSDPRAILCDGLPRSHREDVEQVHDPIDAARGAGLVIVATEWQVFRQSARRLDEVAPGTTVLDLRGILADLAPLFEEQGIRYERVGVDSMLR
jgi:UDPglucose 6-dehydrogenase